MKYFWSECGNWKVKYKTREEAKTNAERIKKEELEYGHWLQVYICSYCKFYHIGRMRLPPLIRNYYSAMFTSLDTTK